MTERYQLLHYPGDVTSAVAEGDILGHDPAGRPYEVIDTEVDTACGDAIPHDCRCDKRTTVHLQPATPENILRHLERRGLLEGMTGA